MRSVLVLSFIAALGLVVSNVQAQEAGDVSASQAAVAPAVDASQTVVVSNGNCQECEGSVGFGFGLGIGLFGAGINDRIEQRRIEIGQRRQIVQASPYAVPSGELQDWARFRNYPYGYYPQNFGTPDMRVPGYNPAWQNYYPSARRYHQGNHFNLDVF